MDNQMPKDERERRKMFEARHGKIWADTDICEAWMRHHNRCCGCKHEKKCKAAVLWTLSIMDGHSPEEFLDDPMKYNPR